MPPIEFICLGTGSSASVPNIACLTAPPEQPPCRTCLSTLQPEGKKNIRRNITAAIRVPSPKDPARIVDIVIDCGKDFRQAAMEFFPKYKLRTIDALLLTHPHADTLGGLDDLRGWTLRNSIQDVIDIYLSQETFNVVERMYPYMVSAELATGGGSVATFNWIIINDRCPFEIGDTGVVVTPYAVHHGVRSPNKTNVSTAKEAPNGVSEGVSDGPDTASSLPEPFFCYAFKLDKIVYMSDVSFVPGDVWPLLFPTSPFATRGQTISENRLHLLILDCLYLKQYPAHLSLGQAYEYAYKIGARNTYLVGMTHNVAHDEYLQIAVALENNIEITEDMSDNEKQGIVDARDGIRRADVPLPKDPLYIRPAYDGLRLLIEDDKVIECE